MSQTLMVAAVGLLIALMNEVSGRLRARTASRERQEIADAARERSASIRAAVIDSNSHTEGE